VLASTRVVDSVRLKRDQHGAELNYRGERVADRISTMEHANRDYLHALSSSTVRTVKAAIRRATKGLKSE